MAQTVIAPTMLESCVRDVLNAQAPRSVVGDGAVVELVQ